MNKWIMHVKEFARDNNLSYMCALSGPRCRASYRKVSVKKREKVENIGDIRKNIIAQVIRDKKAMK